MAYMHARSIVHFDIKPDNLLVERLPGGRGFAMKVADFGLSKMKVRKFVSAVTDLRGTLPYMAPELVMEPEMVRGGFIPELDLTCFDVIVSYVIAAFAPLLVFPSSARFTLQSFKRTRRLGVLMRDMTSVIGKT